METDSAEIMVTEFMEPDTIKSKESFWKTLPGILTGIATLVTAIGGFIVILVQLGVFASAENTTPPAQQSALPPKVSTPASTNLTAVADDIEYTILSKSTSAYSQAEHKLTLNMKVSCKQTSIGFTPDIFRLEIEGVKYAPHNELSSQWIANHADWKESLEFIIPKTLRSATLHVGQAGTPRTSTILITLP
jgi:hypothetical protein